MNPNHDTNQYERDVLSQLNIEVDHIADNGSSKHFDAILEEPFGAPGTPIIGLVGTVLVEAGTRLELKTCQRWNTDTHANGGRRRGRFNIREENHLKRLEDDVPTLFAVLDDEEVLAATLVPVAFVDPLVARKWSNGDRRYGERVALIRWPNFVSEERLAEEVDL